MGLIREESVGFKELFVKKKALLDAEVSMVVSEQGIALAYIADAEQNKINGEYFERDDITAIRDWVLANKLQGKGVCLVLNCKQFQLYQVEPPSVPKEELNQAILYSLRDRLDYPVNEAQIDSFAMPKDASRGARAKVNVVAAHLPQLIRKIDLIKKSGLTPSIIDIPEMAYRDILLTRDSMGKGICLVNYHEQFVTLMIFRKGKFYLSRQINIPSWNACLAANGDAASENLLLEIQRTLDYYQSQLNQPPIAEIILPDWSEPLQPLLDYLQKNLGHPVTRLENICVDKSKYGMAALRELMLASVALFKNSSLDQANNQQVNLYRGQLLPTPEALPINTLAYAAVAGVVLSFLMWFMQWNGLDKVKKLSQTQQKQQQKMISQLSELQALIPTADVEARATASIQKLQNQLQQRQQTSELIKQLNKTQGKGFSSIFKDLSQVKNKDIWLTRVFIKNHNINLEGKTLESSSVANMVIQLQKMPNTSDIKFKEVNIERKKVKDRVAGFYLYSDAEAVSDGI